MSSSSYFKLFYHRMFHLVKSPSSSSLTFLTCGGSFLLGPPPNRFSVERTPVTIFRFYKLGSTWFGNTCLELPEITDEFRDVLPPGLNKPPALRPWPLIPKAVPPKALVYLEPPNGEEDGKAAGSLGALDWPEGLPKTDWGPECWLDCWFWLFPNRLWVRAGAVDGAPAFPKRELDFYCSDDLPNKPPSFDLLGSLLELLPNILPCMGGLPFGSPNMFPAFGLLWSPPNRLLDGDLFVSFFPNRLPTFGLF